MSQAYHSEKDIVFLYSLDNCLFSEASLANIWSQSVACFFHSLDLSFTEQYFLILMTFCLSIISFINCAFGVVAKNRKAIFTYVGLMGWQREGFFSVFFGKWHFWLSYLWMYSVVNFPPSCGWEKLFLQHLLSCFSTWDTLYMWKFLQEDGILLLIFLFTKANLSS